MKGQLRIEQMYAFTVVDDDGTEGIPAFSGPGGLAMPMVGADLARVDSLRPIAQQMARELGKPVTLLRFTGREELEVIEAASITSNPTKEEHTNGTGNAVGDATQERRPR